MHAAKPGQDTARVVLLWVVSRRGWLGAVPHCRLPCKNLGFSFLFLFFPLQFLFIFKVMPPRRKGQLWPELTLQGLPEDTVRSESRRSLPRWPLLLYDRRWLWLPRQLLLGFPEHPS